MRDTLTGLIIADIFLVAVIHALNTLITLQIINVVSDSTSLANGIHVTAHNEIDGFGGGITVETVVRLCY